VAFIVIKIEHLSSYRVAHLTFFFVFFCKSLFSYFPTSCFTVNVQ